MDILLPGMEGREVIRQVKKSPRTEAILVIAITALTRKEDRDRILQSGRDDYVSKPYDLDELEAVILRHLHLCHS